MLRTILITTALIAPSQLFAQASAERAAAIAAELDRYLPGDASVVTAQVSGADYSVTIDLAAMGKSQADNGLTIEATPLTLLLSEAANGTYGVSYDQPLSGKINYRDDFTLDFAIARLSGEGQFDPSLGAFTKHDMSYDGVSYAQTSSPASGMGSVIYKIAEMTATSAARANPAGGVDVDASYQGKGLTEDLIMPDPMTGEQMTLNISAATMDGTVKFTGSRATAMLDLAAYALQNLPPSEGAADQQDALKAKIRAAVPFFETMIVESSVSDLSVETPVGTFGAAAAVVNAAANGVVEAGHFHETIALTGLTLPEGLLPEWATSLIPADSSISFDISQFDLAAPLAIVLDKVDFKTGPTSEDEAALTAALLPSGIANMGLSLAAANAGTYEFEGTADFQVGQNSRPVGMARLSLSGIDAILAALNTAPADIKQGAIPAISMMRGLGKSDGDATTWDIEFTESGGLFVNGNDMSMFMQ